MRAVTFERYGGPEVLRLQQLEKPVPDEREVLVRIEASGVATGDGLVMRGTPFMVRLVFGLTKPKVHVLGSDLAGVVEAVGSEVDELAPGDEVFGSTADAGFGTFAEYVTAPVEALAPKPAGLSFEEAAVVPGSALAALQGLRDAGGLESDQRVLVNGASGAVGHYAVQIARALGAHVTGTCSTPNVDFVRSLGADEVIDYTRDDFRSLERTWDLVLDLAAFRPVRESLRAVERGGTYVMVGGSGGVTAQAILLGPILSKIAAKRVVFFITKPDPKDLRTLTRMIDEGALRPHVDRRFTLEEVPEAIRYLESGASRGKVVVRSSGG